MKKDESDEKKKGEKIDRKNVVSWQFVSNKSKERIIV